MTDNHVIHFAAHDLGGGQEPGRGVDGGLRVVKLELGRLQQGDTGSFINVAAFDAQYWNCCAPYSDAS